MWYSVSFYNLLDISILGNTYLDGKMAILIGGLRDDLGTERRLVPFHRHPLIVYWTILVVRISDHQKL